MCLQVTVLPKERKAPSEDYSCLVSWLSALSWWPIYCPHRGYSWVSLIYLQSALKRLKQYNAAGSSIKGEENWNAVVVWRNYCVWHSYDCGKACDENWFGHKSAPFLNMWELQASSTEWTQAMQMHLGRLVLQLLLSQNSHTCFSLLWPACQV